MDEASLKQPAKPGHGISLNEKASISSEELNAGVETHEATMEDKILAKYTYPGSKPATKEPVPAYKPMEWGDITKKPDDPTMDFSILLIAKPIPFKFELLPRDAKRASDVRDLFNQGVEQGEYTQNREYWGPNQGRDKPLGWSKV